MVIIPQIDKEINRVLRDFIRLIRIVFLTVFDLHSF